MVWALNATPTNSKGLDIYFPKPVANASGHYDYSYRFVFKGALSDCPLFANKTALGAATSAELYYVKSSVLEVRSPGNANTNSSHGAVYDEFNEYLVKHTYSGGAKQRKIYINGSATPVAIHTISDITGFEIQALFPFGTASRGGELKLLQFIDVYGGVNKTYDANLSNGTGTMLPPDGVQTGAWPADNTEWKYYEESEPADGHAIAWSALATLQLIGHKVGQAASAVISTAAAQVNASKIAKAQATALGSASASLGGVKVGNAELAVTANSAATVVANKTGSGTASINATAAINLTAGSVITVQANINFNATASISVQGSKCANASVAFASTATSQLQASKTGAANVNLAAGSMASLSSNKIGSAAASLQCAVAQSLQSSKTGYSSFTVPVSISITLSGLSAATKPVAQVVFINTRSQQKSLLTTSSQQQHRIKNYSRQRYNLQSGGASA